MDCPECQQPIPAHVDRCPTDFTDVGAPNVRAASTHVERTALDVRYRQAELAADADGTRAVFDQFRDEVKRSRAVICRPLDELKRLAFGDLATYATFYGLVRGGLRLPESNEFDLNRSAVDSMFFPMYHEAIRFAALTLDGQGVGSYGKSQACSMVLRDGTISKRATVFEENTYFFISRHRCVPTEPLPAGYRAAWADRDKLAAAKLQSELKPGMTVSDFPRVLLKTIGKGTTATEDFVEVHIYGPLSRRGIERVVIPKFKTKADQTNVKNIRRLLEAISCEVEERP